MMVEGSLCKIKARDGSLESLDLVDHVSRKHPETMWGLGRDEFIELIRKALEESSEVYEDVRAQDIL